MEIVFRTDASLDIGTGHVMRCLTLAHALREKGARCRFVCCAHKGNLLELILERGFEARPLPRSDGRGREVDAQSGTRPRHAAWLGNDWETDAQHSLAALGGAPVDWLIVDHYAIDVRWERRLRPACTRLMVIDDLADRAHDCDLLIDQNLGRLTADYAYLVPNGCRILVGPKYALLRPEFGELRPYSLARRASPQLNRLLITMGGVDKNNATGQVLEALFDSVLPADCRITVIMGPHAPWVEQVRRMAATMPWSTEVQTNVRDMARLMAESDLAIGAGGTTALERCCLGLPTLTLVLANNQQAGAMALQAVGATLILDDAVDIASDFKAKLTLLGRPQALLKMQGACRSITDGTGATKLAAELSHL
jgi:UDP-2,4-diacetamido-2,4,6-trideoxy-beta-L-altropyranose hydrolase